LTDAISAGVLVDRDGPDESNGFIWRITFLDNAPASGSDFKLSLSTNSLTTAGNVGSTSILTTLLVDGETFTSCSGTLVVPSFGGLVKGLEYHARVSAVNSQGYSLPQSDLNPQAPMVVPGTPTGVTLDVISATELRVLFGPPSDNGGDTITQYLVEWSTNINFSNAESDTLDYLAGGAPFFKTISGLLTGIHYFVRVCAKNSQGFGISQVTTPRSLNPHQKPAPPTNVKLGVTSDTMLTVSWNTPSSNGGDVITNYRVEWDTNPGFSSGSMPPNKGYADVEASMQASYTVELLSMSIPYYVRVFATNNAGFGIPQTATPNSVTLAKQIPGTPHTLVANTGNIPRTIEVVWQRPRVPHHGIPCSGFSSNVMDCPTPYGGNVPSSDGGDLIVEYEVEHNESPDFGGSDGKRKLVTGLNCVLENLTEGRTYYIRVLARNKIGSGRYCEKSGTDICDGNLVSAIAS